MIVHSKLSSILIICLLLFSCLSMFTFEVKAIDTGFKYPTAEGKVKSEWDHADRLYASDNSKAGCLNWGGTYVLQDVYNFNFPTVANIVEGIEIEMEANMLSPAGGDCNMYIKLSGDGGVTFTAEKTFNVFGTGEAVYTLGNSVETWGKTWLPSNFTNANFLCYMRVANCNSPEVCEVDCVRVKVYSNCSSVLIDNIWPDDTSHVTCTWNETLGAVISNGTGTNVTIWLVDNDGNTSTTTAITTNPQTVTRDVSGKNLTPCNTYSWGVCIQTLCDWKNKSYTFTIDNTKSTITNIKFIGGRYVNNSNVPVIYWIYGHPLDSYTGDDRMTFTLTDCDWAKFGQVINISIHFHNDTGPVWWNYSGVGTGGWTWPSWIFGKDWSVGTHKIWINVTDCGGTYCYWVNLILVSPVTTLAPTDIGFYSATLNGDWINGCGPVRGFWFGDEWDVNSSNYDTNYSMDYTEILDNGQSLDLNNDSLYNSEDLVFFYYYYGAVGVGPGDPAYPCDLNLDTKVDFHDAGILVYYWGNEDYTIQLNLKPTWHYSYLAWYIGSWYTGGPMDLFTLPTPPINFRVLDRQDNLVTLAWTNAITNDPDNRTTVIVYSNSSCPTNVTDGTWLLETSNSSYIWNMPISDTGIWYVSAFTNFSGNYSNATCIMISIIQYNYTVNLRHEDPIKDWDWVDLNDSAVGRHKFIIHYKDGTTETNEFNKDLWTLYLGLNWTDACNDFNEELDVFEDKIKDMTKPATGMYIDNVVVDCYTVKHFSGFGFSKIEYQYHHYLTPPYDRYKFRFSVEFGEEWNEALLDVGTTVNIYAGDTLIPVIVSLSDNGVRKLIGTSGEIPGWIGPITSWKFELWYALSEIQHKQGYLTDVKVNWYTWKTYTPITTTTTPWVALTPNVHYYNGGLYAFGLGDENSNPSSLPLDNPLVVPWYHTIWSRNPTTEAKNILADKEDIVVSGEGDDHATWYFKLSDITTGVYPYLTFTKNLTFGSDKEFIPKSEMYVDHTIDFPSSYSIWSPWNDGGLDENWTDWVEDYDCSDGAANFTAWWNNVNGNLTDWLDDYGMAPPAWPSLPQYLGLTEAPGWDLETEGMEDPDPTDGKWYVNVTKEIDWVEFIWSESDEIFNISWNTSDYCDRKLVIDQDMKNTESFTFWIRNDLLRSIYGWSMPGMALGDYNINFLNVPENCYGVIYCYDPDGNELLIHSEYLDSQYAIHPMLIFGKTYYCRLIKPDGVIVECGMFTAESQRDLTFDGNKIAPAYNIYDYCEINSSFISNGFQVSFLGPAGTLWTSFQVYDSNHTLVYAVGPLAFLNDFDFQFTTINGYVSGDVYYYQITTEIDVGVLSTPLVPIQQIAVPTFDAEKVNTYFGIMFGPSPLFLGNTHIDWIYILILIFCLLALFSVVRGKEVGLIVEGITMIISAVIVPDIGAKVGLGAMGMALVILGIIALLRESEEESA